MSSKQFDPSKIDSIIQNAMQKMKCKNAKINNLKLKKFLKDRLHKTSRITKITNYQFSKEKTVIDKWNGINPETNRFRDQINDQIQLIKQNPDWSANTHLPSDVNQFVYYYFWYESIYKGPKGEEDIKLRQPVLVKVQNKQISFQEFQGKSNVHSDKKENCYFEKSTKMTDNEFKIILKNKHISTTQNMKREQTKKLLTKFEPYFKEFIEHGCSFDCLKSSPQDEDQKYITKHYEQQANTNINLQDDGQIEIKSFNEPQQAVNDLRDLNSITQQVIKDQSKDHQSLCFGYDQMSEQSANIFEPFQDSLEFSLKILISD